MTNTLILYSANSWLAYVLAERYFQHQHYLWCTPYFDSRSLSNIDATTPPTSTPSEIYHALEAEVKAGDRHSAKIAQNRVGILKGASFKRAAGVITETQEKDIASIVTNAETRDFKPLLYIIPYALASPMLREVPIEQRAHPLSVEYVVEQLPRSSFDIISLSRTS